MQRPNLSKISQKLFHNFRSNLVHRQRQAEKPRQTWDKNGRSNQKSYIHKWNSHANLWIITIEHNIHHTIHSITAHFQHWRNSIVQRVPYYDLLFTNQLVKYQDAFNCNLKNIHKSHDRWHICQSVHTAHWDGRQFLLNDTTIKVLTWQPPSLLLKTSSILTGHLNVLRFTALTVPAKFCSSTVYQYSSHTHNNWSTVETTHKVIAKYLSTTKTIKTIYRQPHYKTMQK